MKLPTSFLVSVVVLAALAAHQWRDAVDWVFASFRAIDSDASEPYDPHDIGPFRGLLMDNDGYLHPDVEITPPSSTQERGLRTTAPLAKGTTVIEVPKKLMLTVSRLAQQSSLAAAVARDGDRMPLGPVTVVIAFLTYALSGGCRTGGRPSISSSTQRPPPSSAVPLVSPCERLKVWLKDLRALDTPAVPFTVEDGNETLLTTHLSRSPEGEWAATLRRGVLDSYNRVVSDTDRSLLGDSFLLESFFKSVALHSSRSFMVDGELVMIPVIDFLNDYGLARQNVLWEFIRDIDVMRVRATRDVAAGEELLGWYGPHSNAHLLTVYGYTSPPRHEMSWSCRIGTAERLAKFHPKWDRSWRTVPIELHAPANPHNITSPSADGVVLPPAPPPGTLPNTPPKEVIELSRLLHRKLIDETPMLTALEAWRGVWAIWEQTLTGIMANSQYEKDPQLTKAVKRVAKRRKRLEKSAGSTGEVDVSRRAVVWWGERDTDGKDATNMDTAAVNAMRVKMSEYLALLTYREAFRILQGKKTMDVSFTAEQWMAQQLHRALVQR
ncbi:unnamed protein product [Vitrella brassicaformis CCMP3155]|uniref:SET domain-containing protein n=2 Tax=Vitrella brassicaformis TaxID=1169539 RepID=A0A0G4G6Q6_VITBC|nr:unnamed protein product [Vitrella brassicaformis CCMP3155]|eukprot:CEM24359.1 unnamed protein product [Vitrella brassicaformis CCMP3155]